MWVNKKNVAWQSRVGNIVCFLLRNSLTSEFYMLMFQNTLSVPSSQAYLPMKMEWMECSETSAHKIQMMGNYPKESIQHSGYGESLK